MVSGMLSASLAEEAKVPVTVVRILDDEEASVQDAIANALTPTEETVSYTMPGSPLPRNQRPVVVGVDGSETSKHVFAFRHRFRGPASRSPAGHVLLAAESSSVVIEGMRTPSLPSPSARRRRNACLMNCSIRFRFHQRTFPTISKSNRTLSIFPPRRGLSRLPATHVI